MSRKRAMGDPIGNELKRIRDSMTGNADDIEAHVGGQEQDLQCRTDNSKEHSVYGNRVNFRGAPGTARTGGRMPTFTRYWQFGWGLKSQGNSTDGSESASGTAGVTLSDDKTRGSYKNQGAMTNPFVRTVRQPNPFRPKPLEWHVTQPDQTPATQEGRNSDETKSVRQNQEDLNVGMPNSSQWSNLGRPAGPRSAEAPTPPPMPGGSQEHDSSAETSQENSDGRYEQKYFDWDRQARLAGTDLLASLPAAKRVRAKEIGLERQIVRGVDFRRREWVTNWVKVDGFFKKKNFRSGETCFAISTFDAEAILTSTEKRESIITAVREEMKLRDRKAKITVENAVAFNPWYRYVYMRGYGEVIWEAMKTLHKLLKECVYDKFSPHELKRAIPPVPPLSRRGVRPMILMAHFDPAIKEIPVNRGFCYECVSDDHVFCEVDHHAPAEEAYEPDHLGGYW